MWLADNAVDLVASTQWRPSPDIFEGEVDDDDARHPSSHPLFDGGPRGHGVEDDGQGKGEGEAGGGDGGRWRRRWWTMIRHCFGVERGRRLILHGGGDNPKWGVTHRLYADKKLRTFRTFRTSEVYFLCISMQVVSRGRKEAYLRSVLSVLFFLFVFFSYPSF